MEAANAQRMTKTSLHHVQVTMRQHGVLRRGAGSLLNVLLPTARACTSTLRTLPIRMQRAENKIHFLQRAAASTYSTDIVTIGVFVHAATIHSLIPLPLFPFVRYHGMLRQNHRVPHERYAPGNGKPPAATWRQHRGRAKRLELRNVPGRNTVLGGGRQFHCGQAWVVRNSQLVAVDWG